MKKRVVSLFLALVLALSLTGTALAAAGSSTTVTPVGGNVTATLNGDKVELTVSSLTSGQQYLVLMVSGVCTDVSQVQITESTIRYIDQKADTNGTVTFTIYPDSMQSSTIVLSGGTEGLRIVATVTVPYIRGDANLNGNVNLLDATLAARHAVGVPGAKLTGDAFAAADVNGSNSVNLLDATKIAKYALNKTWD